MENTDPKITSIVLAGGKSLRMGSSKVLKLLGGKSLLERVLERLKPLNTRILIVTSPDTIDLSLTDSPEVVVDLYSGQGPLGGIYTGLMASKSPYNLVVACDMPFLNQGLLEHMMGLASGFDAVVPRLAEGNAEPLHGVYSQSCRGKMRQWLEQDRLQINQFLRTVRVRYLEKAECQRFDPELLSFFNINTQSDLDRAARLVARNKTA
ncbi:molybdenum cofactor guanylyltransferase [Chloroflexota bacterium]